MPKLNDTVFSEFFYIGLDTQFQVLYIFSAGRLFYYNFFACYFIFRLLSRIYLRYYVM